MSRTERPAGESPVSESGLYDTGPPAGADAPEVLAFAKRRDNGELIAQAAQLGYLRADWPTLDVTFSKGTFWKDWRPDTLWATDIRPMPEPYPEVNYASGVDFRHQPWEDGAWRVVVFDPDYKLEGTNRIPGMVEGYGVTPKTAAERMDDIVTGVRECWRVLAPKGYLLVKCQDQVALGHVVWQSDIVTDVVRELGGWKVDRLDLLGSVTQPKGRTKRCPECKGLGCWNCVEGRVPSVQQHARRNASQLLIFRKSKPPALTRRYHPSTTEES